MLLEEQSAVCWNTVLQLDKQKALSRTCLKELGTMTTFPKNKEQGYLAVLEGTAEGILIANLDNRKFVFANSAICKMFGYSREEMLSLGVDDIHPPNRLAEVTKIFEAQARGDYKLALSVPCLHKDRTEFSANINTTQVSIDGVACNVGFFTNDAELLAATKALAKAKRDLELIFDGIPHPTVILDSDHNILQGNKKFEEVVGGNKSEYEKLPCWQVFHNLEGSERPKDCPFRFSEYSTCPVSREMPVEALGGYYIVSCTPLYDEQGRLEKIVHILTDITERKKAEEQLKRSEARYSSIVKNIGDGIIVHDFEGAILDVNEAVCESLGYSREELIGANLAMIDSNFDVNKIQSRMKRLVREGSIKFDGKHVRKNGELFDVHINARVINAEGEGLVQAMHNGPLRG